MVELILVIIIFGIIATIGASMIATMYQNYIRARIINYLQAQSDITLQQIAKRLQYRIKETAVAKISSSPDILPLYNSGVTDKYDVIQWIGYSNEAMLTPIVTVPGWSGFIDLNDEINTNSTNKRLSTPGSDLAFANTIISALTNNAVTMSSGGVALMFKGLPVSAVDPVTGYGWNATVADDDYVVRVTASTNNVFNIVGDAPDTIYEQYYLAHTAYAIAPEGTNPTDFNLTLRYNFQPWLGQRYNDTNTKSALLATNVNLFRIRQVGSTIRLKLCLHDGNNSGIGDYVVTCKEEVVL
jgi:Tfp pilus assembly protein PilE